MYDHQILSSETSGMEKNKNHLGRFSSSEVVNTQVSLGSLGPICSVLLMTVGMLWKQLNVQTSQDVTERPLGQSSICGNTVFPRTSG